jgi:ACS family D-galactonate transporter-like MFS transporter
MISNFNAGERPTRIRHHVLVMLFVTVVINYLDRSNLSVAATHVAGDLQIDTKHMGLLFSAFGWAYVAFQIPGGWLADCIRPRLLMALVCGLWSLATLLQGFAGTFVLLFSLRLLVGMFEAPSYPINATGWRRRGFPTANARAPSAVIPPASLSASRF